MKVESNLPMRESGKEDKWPDELPMLGECRIIRIERHEVDIFLTLIKSHTDRDPKEE